MPNTESAPRVPSYRRHKPPGQAVVTLVQLYAFQRRVDTQVAKLLDEFRTALYDGDSA